MVKNPEKNKGFIAILSLLIVATISMIIAISLLKDGVDNASLSLQSIYFENAKMNATICVEDTLLRLKLEEQFNGNLDYDIAPGQACSTTITWYTPQQTTPSLQETLVDLEVTGTTESFSRSFLYEIKVKRYDVNDVDASLEYSNNIDIISIQELNS